MTSLSLLLERDGAIALNLDVSSRKRLFEEAAALLAPLGGCDKQTIFEALIAREKLGSTAVGNLVALPHARVEGLTEACLLFIRTKEVFDYDGAKAPGAQLFFVLAIPPNATDEHLEVLSQIAHFVENKKNRTALLAATTTKDIIEALK